MQSEEQRKTNMLAAIHSMIEKLDFKTVKYIYYFVLGCFSD